MSMAVDLLPDCEGLMDCWGDAAGGIFFFVLLPLAIYAWWVNRKDGDK